MSSIGTEERLTAASIFSEPGDGYIESNGVCYCFHLQYQVCDDKDHKHSQENFLDQRELDTTTS